MAKRCKAYGRLVAAGVLDHMVPHKAQRASRAGNWSVRRFCWVAMQRQSIRTWPIITVSKVQLPSKTLPSCHCPFGNLTWPQLEDIDAAGEVGS